MMATKLNAQVIIKNLQNMHENFLPPTGARRRMELEYQDWARLQGRGPRTGGPFDRTIGCTIGRLSCGYHQALETKPLLKCAPGA